MTELKTIETWLDKQKDTLLESQRDKDLYASGYSANNTYTSMYDNGGRLIGPAYWKQQEEGRAPGALPPIAAIEAWLKVRGLPHSPWAVAIKIAKDGTVAFQQGGTDVISDVINQESIDDLISELGLTIRTNVSSEILNTWQSQ